MRMDLFSKEEQAEFIRKNKELINSKKTTKIFQEVYNKAEQQDLKIFYDFLGELLLENPDLLDGKILRQYLMFVKKVRIPPQQLIELETYFLKKYSLFNGEELLIAFNGELIYKRYSRLYKYSGRTFITNFRVIVIGKGVEIEKII